MPINYSNLIIGIIIYSIGTLIQHISLRQFANLRIKKENCKTNTSHYMPTGFMFEFISSPHYFAEILIYLGICFILEFYINLLIIFLFVTILHIPMALQTHDWYLKTFKNYPKNRKALIPFLF